MKKKLLAIVLAAALLGGSVVRSEDDFEMVYHLGSGYAIPNPEDTPYIEELARLEGIIPAIESAHAVAFGMKLAKRMDHGSVLINLSGRGDKDMDYIIENYGIR